MNALTTKHMTGNIDYTVTGDPVCILGRYTLEGNDSGKLQRVETRHKTLGLMAIVSDGKSQYFSIVEELSAQGLRLGKIPADFDQSADRCTAVVLAPFDDLNITLNFRWMRETNRGMYKTVGFHIPTPPYAWQSLVNDLKMENDHLSFLLFKDDSREIQ
jgi:hypothetical protein